MSTLRCSPDRDCFNSLGIPVDNLTLNSAVERIVAMARADDGRARLVSTLNVDFLVNALGTVFSRPRHPELLQVLRSSDLVTADGFPIVWLSRLLGRPLPERVCGSDLLPALAQRAARDGLSLYLFGGGEGAAAAAAAALQARYPGLRIAGTAAPPVHTAGAGLARSAGDDRATLAQIHAAGADILLVGLGNPKQELWFNRNRRALRTPVAIGVGGSFDFVTGRVRRAPPAWQRRNLEWLWRLAQDPARLWQRYSKGLFKFAALAAPVLAARAMELLRAPPGGHRPPRPGAWQRLWSSRETSIAIRRLPPRPDAAYLRALNRELAAPAPGSDLRILDFSAVQRIAIAAQPELFSLAALLQRHPRQLQLLGMSAGLRRQLRSARLLDLLQGGRGRAIDALAGDLGSSGQFGCRSYSLRGRALVMLSGRVDREALAALGFVECLQSALRDRRAVIDLRNVTLLESSGIAELLPLLAMRRDGCALVAFSGADYAARQMLRMAGVGAGTRCIDDQELLTLISEADSHA